MNTVKEYKGKIPKLTTPEMIEVDRLMMEEYHIELIQMMENAGRCLAILAVDRFLKNNLNIKRVTILAGTGGNGGGAMVCARRLHNRGVNVRVYLTADEDKMTLIPLHQLKILKRIGIDIRSGSTLKRKLKTDLIIDGIIGYSIKGDPFGIPKIMIDWANKQDVPILSLDTPSGLDLTSGKVHQPTIAAKATMTLALPKKGLYKAAARKVRGELYLGDISVPAELYKEKSLKINVSRLLFAETDVLKIDGIGKKKSKKKRKKRKSKK